MSGSMNKKTTRSIGETQSVENNSYNRRITNKYDNRRLTSIWAQLLFAFLLQFDQWNKNKQNVGSENDAGVDHSLFFATYVYI